MLRKARPKKPSAYAKNKARKLMLAYMGGKIGRLFGVMKLKNNPYYPGSELYEAWALGWRQGKQ